MIRARFGKTAAGRLLLGAGALALLVPAIAGCEAGNGAPTLEFHAASAGAQTVVNGIRITNVFVLGAPSGASLPAGSSASLFLSLFNDGATADTLQSVTAAGTAASVTLDGGTVAAPVGDPGQPDRAAAVGGAQQPVRAARVRGLRRGDPAVQERGPGDAPGPGGAAVLLLVDLLPGAERPGQLARRHPGDHRGAELDGDAERDANVTQREPSAETAVARRPAFGQGGGPQRLRRHAAGDQPTDSNLYPSPRTVTMCRGLAGSASILARSRLMCTSRVLVSPT